LNETLAKNGTINEKVLNELLNKIDAIGSAKLDQSQLDALLKALENLEKTQVAQKGAIDALAANTKSLLSELIDAVKDLKNINQPQQQQQQSKHNLPAFEQSMETLKTNVNELKTAIDNTTKDDKHQTINFSEDAWKKIPDIKTALNSIRDQIVALSKEKDPPRTHFDKTVELEKVLADLNAHLALLLFRSENLFKNDPQRKWSGQLNSGKGGWLSKDPKITFVDTKGHDECVKDLRDLNKQMHSFVDEVYIHCQDITKHGVDIGSPQKHYGIVKLGQNAILSLCDDTRPRDFSCYGVLREMHLRGWIELDAGADPKKLGLGKQLDFKYSGVYQKERTIEASAPSQWRWSSLAWGAAITAPVASALLFSAVGGTAASMAIVSAPLLAAGALGWSIGSTVQALLNTKFSVQLRKNAIGQAYSPERMIAEAVGVAFSLQNLSRQVGKLDLTVMPGMKGLVSNDPYEMSVNPAITAIKRVVLNFNGIALGNATDARNLRSEYESSLREIEKNIPVLTAAWSRFLTPAVDIMKKELGFGIFGATGGVLGRFMGL
jgi:predicted  nucleic acid-binding Zn-ribbon protein